MRLAVTRQAESCASFGAKWKKNSGRFSCTPCINRSAYS
jgi:hypothetical protein